MFKRISRIIALQFTAFIFILLLLNGFLFLAADLGNEQRQMRFRLERMAEGIAGRFEMGVSPFLPREVPPGMRDRIQILDEEGGVLFGNPFFEDIPFEKGQGFTQFSVQGEQYAVLTEPIVREGRTVGYAQVVDVVRLQMQDLPLRILLYLALSGAISVLIYVVSLAFAKRTLQPAEEMVERLEQFTQDASHELRTPLATLSSSLDLALRNGKHREGILSAKDDLKQAEVLVERLLELARLDKFLLETSSVDLSTMVEEAVERHRAFAAEKHITLEASIAAKVKVKGDAALLRQVVGNLLANAIKFSKPAGGTITVTLTKTALTIADTGIGIKEDQMVHVFDRFFQADASRARGGFGLGLALVRRIVELHGWTISVQSTKGKGTAFRIDISAGA
ncbi:MAG: HAMP domain-containing sensor histidine kinase [Candidatus Peribacteraceae bacterium]|nr:HAMP domain-containing sensor histidine kinase [Candidatus Peribacteraceae bacterium]